MAQHPKRSASRAALALAALVLTFTSMAPVSTIQPVARAVSAAGPAGADAIGEVVAQVETEPIPHAGDAADDAAIWIHPTDPGQSVIIGTDKQEGGGLAVYDLSGAELHYLADGQKNNVDLRSGFPAAGHQISLVAASTKHSSSIALYQLDSATRQLIPIGARELPVGFKAVGMCMYHSPLSGKFYAFVTGGGGKVQQWELFDNGAGQVDGTVVRSWTLRAMVESCAVDDATGHFFVSEETAGIWRYGAEATAGTSEGDRVLVDSTGPDGHLTADVEGLAFADGPAGGYLVASSQGNDSFVAYARAAPYTHLFTFTIADSAAIDGAEHTDGIDLTSTPLGSTFPAGVLVVQDGRNPGSTQNFKLVSWQTVLDAMAVAAPVP